MEATPQETEGKTEDKVEDLTARKKELAKELKIELRKAAKVFSRHAKNKKKSHAKPAPKAEPIEDPEPVVELKKAKKLVEHKIVVPDCGDECDDIKSLKKSRKEVMEESAEKLDKAKTPGANQLHNPSMCPSLGALGSSGTIATVS